MEVTERLQYHRAVDDICGLNWQDLTSQDMIGVAWAYYYFSIQFRENLEAARSLYPDDDNLKHLQREECDTDNLSPWPGVAEIGEKMNHDEYMRRTLELLPIEASKVEHFTAIGEAYLAYVRQFDKMSRALSITSYEDGGLEKVFTAILEFGSWNNSLLRSFEHFLAEHVRFDSDPDQGHGALSRHIKPDDRVLPLWDAFKDLFVACVPRLAA
jgi:hypothetical protein